MSNKIVNINISEICVTKEDVVICTVLGSCVSVCLYTDDEIAGGINHFALPNLPLNQVEDKLRYGDWAIEYLVQQMKEITNKHSSTFRAKLIGGANNIAVTSESQKVGTANIDVARKILDRHQIKIANEEVGGNIGRKILFHVKSGRLQSAFVGPGFFRPSAQKAIAKPFQKKKKI